MKKLIEKTRILYHKFRETRVGFLFTVWLKDSGLFEKIYNILFKQMDDANQNRAYFEQNKVYFAQLGGIKLDYVGSLLYDEYSKKVWRATLKFRLTGEEIPKELYSLSEEYFPRDVINLQDGEVFIDCGCYIGDTIQSFKNHAKRSGVRWKRIISFEPDKKWYDQASRYFKNDKRVIIKNLGMYKERGTISFNERNDGAGRISDVGTMQINVTCLDLEKDCQDATFIKMDIEGAEMDALEGAKGLIKRNKPKLAICIYHSNEDMVRIIEWVHNLVPEYKLYVRNHSGKALDTVLYAVV